jgi:iron complex outermembrane recepter protein
MCSRHQCCQPNPDTTVLNPIVVNESAEGEHFELFQETGVTSYLGLTPVETPAMVDIVTQDEMQEQGLSDLIDVYNAMPGVMSGNNPGEPGMLTMRGFPRKSTGYLVDGVPTVDPVVMTRNYDSYHFERVGALKGPASVISGTGALAGAVNVVTRKPKLGETSREAFVSIGSFDSYRVGATFNQPVNDDTAVNATLTYSQSAGYIDDTDLQKFGNRMIRGLSHLFPSTG